jgi:hypothetical protein
MDLLVSTLDLFFPDTSWLLYTKLMYRIRLPSEQSVTLHMLFGKPIREAWKRLEWHKLW